MLFIDKNKTVQITVYSVLKSTKIYNHIGYQCFKLR